MLTLNERREFDRITSRRAFRPVPADVLARANSLREHRMDSGRKLGELSLDELLAEILPMAGGASSFTLTLDTTAPADVSISINAGDSTTNSQSVTATIATSDTPTTGYTMKIWGDVDESDNANIQIAEGDSSWITYSTSQAVLLSSGDGTKTLNVKVRDDVWNVSSGAADSITLDTTVPVITISVAASPTKISKIATKDTSTFQFQSDTAITAWKVKVVSASGSIHSSGTQIPTTAGSTDVTGAALAATTNQTVTIVGGDLETAGAEGDNVVKVFGQDAAGNWST